MSVRNLFYMKHLINCYIFPLSQVFECQKLVAYETPQKLFHFSTELSFGMSHMDQLKNYEFFVT